jgi:hypothetical protein
VSRASAIAAAAPALVDDGAHREAEGAGGASVDAAAFAELLIGVWPRLPASPPATGAAERATGGGVGAAARPETGHPDDRARRPPSPVGADARGRHGEHLRGGARPGAVLRDGAARGGAARAGAPPDGAPRDGAPRPEAPTTAESIETAVRLAAARHLGQAPTVAPPRPPFGAAPGPRHAPEAGLCAPRVEGSPLAPLAAAVGAAVSLEGDIARVEIPHPELGAVALVVSAADGELAVRATTPSTELALALRAAEPALREALAARGVPLRSLRIDVTSDARLHTSRDGRRVRMPRREQEG